MKNSLKNYFSTLTREIFYDSFLTSIFKKENNIFLLIEESSHFPFSYSYMVGKILLLGQIFELNTLIDLHLSRIPESENRIFSGWSVC